MFIENIIVSLSSAALVALAGYLWHHFRTVRQNRIFRWFWGLPSPDDPILVVFSKTQRLPDHDTGRSAERSLNINSAIALAEISSFLWKMHYKIRLVSSDESLTEHDAEANLVLLGGTLGNPVCNQICRELEPRLDVYWFGERGKADEHFLSSRDGKSFRTRFAIGTEHVIECDHGLVLKFHNPKNPNKTVIVLAGNHGAGTLAAARAATDRRILAKVQKNLSLGEELGFVVKGFPRDFDVRQYEIEDLPFKIDSSPRQEQV